MRISKELEEQRERIRKKKHGEWLSLFRQLGEIRPHPRSLTTVWLRQLSREEALLWLRLFELERELFRSKLSKARSVRIKAFLFDAEKPVKSP